VIKSAERRQKKKSRRTADTFPRAYEVAALRNQSRRTADTFPRAYEVAALRNQSRRFFLLFQRCSCDQEGGI